MRLRPFGLVGLLFLGACTATAARPGAASDVSVETLKTVTQQLSSDEFEGRAPGTPGEDKTVAYIAERFAKAGLTPGVKGAWFQDVPLVEAVSAPGALRITGGAAPLDLAYRTDMVANSYRIQPRITLADSDIVFVGYGINAPERGWNDYAGVDVRGKTVIILVNDPDWETPTLDGPFGGRATTYYGRWTYKYEEAARQGAAAAFIVHDTEPAAYPWSVVTSSYTGGQYRIDSPGGGADQSALIGWMTKDAATRLLAAGGQRLEVLSAAARRTGFKAVPLKLKASMTFEQSLKRIASKNVVGMLRGRTRPDDYVLYTAHWDHFGRCDADATGDDICNGAFDNATGVAGLVALAEAQARTGPPERSMLFVAVTAEEFGLLGSEFYARNPVYPLARTVGGINMDGLNILGPVRDTTLIGGGKSDLDRLYTTAAQGRGLVVNREPTPEKGFYYRSDHFSLAKVGVPMLYAKSGQDLVEGGIAAGRAAAEAYTAKHYHQPSDEYDPAWNWGGALIELDLYYRLGRDLATGSAWPQWNPDAEFRAAREASRSGQ